MGKEKAKETLREKIADAFVKALSEDQLPWESMWSSSRAYNAVSEKKYRGVNALWLAFVAEEKGYKDPRWCTFKQLADNGWHLKKGEKHTGIEFWKVFDKKYKEYIDFTEADRRIGADPKRKNDMYISSRYYCVYNAEQMEGIPPLEDKEVSVDVGFIRSRRDVLVKNMGLIFREGGDRAFYSPAEDSITMPPDVNFENDYAYMSTFLHECGHATGSVSRLNRDLTGFFGTESYAKEELRAEIASAFVSQELGFGSEGANLASALDNHKAYIQSWIQVIKDKPNELFAAIKDAEKISDYLIEKGKFKEVEREVEEKEALDDVIGAAESSKAKDVGASFGKEKILKLCK